jgi:hypothetical protein
VYKRHIAAPIFLCSYTIADVERKNFMKFAYSVPVELGFQVTKSVSWRKEHVGVSTVGHILFSN